MNTTITKNGIFWIASYPKSVNQRFQKLLMDEVSKPDTSIFNSRPDNGKISNDRNWIDSILGYSSSYHYQHEIDQIRPHIYDWIANQSDNHQYHQTNETLQKLSGGDYILSKEATKGAVYIVRNPLNITISLTKKLNCSIDRAITLLNDPDMWFSRFQSTSDQIDYNIGTWSDHLESWVNSNDIDMNVTRYEDFILNPEKTFHKMTQSLKPPVPEKGEKPSGNTTVSNTEKLKKQTEKLSSGFISESQREKVDLWREALSSQQIQFICKHHAPMMKRFGYLDDEGNPK